MRHYGKMYFLPLKMRLCARVFYLWFITILSLRLLFGLYSLPPKQTAGKAEDTEDNAVIICFPYDLTHGNGLLMLSDRVLAVVFYF